MISSAWALGTEVESVPMACHPELEKQWLVACACILYVLMIAQHGAMQVAGRKWLLFPAADNGT
jgi:hypothetical protein